MAFNSGRRILQSSTRSLLNCARRTTQSSPKLGGFSATNSLPRRQPFSSTSRVPVELGGAISLMPFHSATASALLNSMLASKVGQWGSLSEGFENPLCAVLFHGPKMFSDSLRGP